MPTILIVDDLEDMTDTLTRVLEAHDYKVVIAHNGVKALERLQEHSIDIMLLDIHLPVKDGLEVLQELRASDWSPKVIAMSGGGRAADFGVLEIAKRFGAHATLKKPFNMTELLAAVESVVTT